MKVKTRKRTVSVCVCVSALADKDLWLTCLWDGLVNIDPSSDGVDLQVLRLLQRHGVSDSCISAKVIIVSSNTQKTGTDQSVFPQKICTGKK